MANSVVVTISARDNASRVFENLGNTIRNNTVLGNLMGQSIAAGVELARRAVTGLGNAFKDAGEIQTSILSTAGDFMKLTGRTFQESTHFINEFSKRMSKVAAELPGQTEDYVTLGRGIMDNLIPAFKALDGSLNLGEYAKTLDDITKFGALRVANTDVTNPQAINAISKALGGSTSLSQLSRLKFFQENPAVLTLIEEEVNKLGGRLEDLSARQRAEIIRNALSVPDEVIEASRNSFSGILEGFRSSLFDPQIGLFGLLRDTDEILTGDQSVLNAVTETLRLIIGEDGIFAKLGGILKSMGFDLDIMDDIYNGITRFNQWLTSINEFLDNFVVRPGELRSREFGRLVGGLINEIIYSLWSVDWVQFGRDVGAGMAELVNMFVAYVGEIDIVAIAGLLQRVFNGLINMIGSLLVNIDWGAYIKALVKAFGLVLIGLNWFSLGKAFFTAFKLVVVGRLVDALGVMIIPIAEGITFVITELIYAIIRSLVTAKDKFVEGWSSVIRGIKSIFDGIKRWGTNGLNSIKSSITNIFSSIKKKIDDLIPDFKNPFAGNKTSFDINYSKVNHAASGLNVGGLFDAIARESKAMPSGSNLVVANSSEAILNRNQQSRLAGMMRPGPSLSIGNITISSNASNPQQIAMEVMRAIDAEWKRYSSNRLAPNY